MQSYQASKQPRKAKQQGGKQGKQGKQDKTSKASNKKQRDIKPDNRVLPN
ncbi:hypothetical protein HCY76_07300 [Limosilactobacillus fermentum]